MVSVSSVQVMWIVAILAVITLFAALFFLRKRHVVDPVSIILLIRSPRLLTAEHIERALREAGVVAERVTEEKTSYFRLWADGYELTIAGAPFPYAKEQLGQTRLIKIREAVQAHEGAILIDSWKAPEGRQREDAMPIMGKIAAALVDDTALAVYQWPTQRINLISDELVESFRAGRVEDAMSTVDHGELKAIESDNERMAEAVAKARAEWPTFVEAWHKASNREEFYAKFPFGEDPAEFMWVSPSKFDSEQLEGTLCSDPHHVKGIKAGDTVKVSISDLNDWLYLDETRHQHGGFTIPVLTEE